jgi:hypothetical protein
MALEHGYSAGPPPVNADGTGDATGEGQVRVRFDANGRASKEIYLRNLSGAAGIIGQPYLYQQRGVAGSGQVVIDVAAVATVNREIVFATDTTPVNTFGWYAFWGVATVLVDGTTDVAAGDWLKLAVGTHATLMLDSTSARSNSSLAVARAASTANSANLTEVFLLGDRAVVNT